MEANKINYELEQQLYPLNPEKALENTTRPFTPFYKGTYDWRSDVYDDGTLYAGKYFVGYSRFAVLQVGRGMVRSMHTYYSQQKDTAIHLSYSVSYVL